MVEGYDISPFAGMLDFNVCGRPWNLRQARFASPHRRRPPNIALQIYNAAIHNQMLARLKEGQPIRR
ncbi:MAG: hypothetical protein JO227_00565 [Acetobacteraceae bacterium]|nr:hypothetical protein [Acetobacteraceae bacterium]